MHKLTAGMEWSRLTGLWDDQIRGWSHLYIHVHRFLFSLEVPSPQWTSSPLPVSPAAQTIKVTHAWMWRSTLRTCVSDVDGKPTYKHTNSGFTVEFHFCLFLCVYVVRNGWNQFVMYSFTLNLKCACGSPWLQPVLGARWPLLTSAALLNLIH